MHSSRMRTARLLTVSHSIQWGGDMPNPPDADPLPPEVDPPGCRCPSHPPPMDRMTDTCENITLPQTSFVGGKCSSVYYPYPVVIIKLQIETFFKFILKLLADQTC